MESHRQIEDQAAAFLARRDSGDWTDTDQAFFDEWLAGSTARRVAVLRLEAVWEEARRLKALSAGLQSDVVPPPGEWQSSPFFSRSQPDRKPRIAHGARLSAAAAAILVAVGIGAFLTFTPAGERYATPIGGVATVPLQDGSNITLNTATQVRVELTSSERDIRLDAGEAFFDVAKDPKRPFVVEIGRKRVVAVGTRFSVRRDGDAIRVAVTEGEVRVEDTGAPLQVRTEFPMGAAPRERETAGMLLSAGSVASTGKSGLLVQEKSVGEVEGELSWRQGYLTFSDISLAAAVAEFNRYNSHRIVIADPRVAALHISGTFRATNYQAFIRVLDRGFSIHAKTSEDTTTLTQD
jgi:transmembrane sensor